MEKYNSTCAITILKKFISKMREEAKSNSVDRLKSGYTPRSFSLEGSLIGGVSEEVMRKCIYKVGGKYTPLPSSMKFEDGKCILTRYEPLRRLNQRLLGGHIPRMSLKVTRPRMRMMTSLMSLRMTSLRMRMMTSLMSLRKTSLNLLKESWPPPAAANGVGFSKLKKSPTVNIVIWKVVVNIVGPIGKVANTVKTGRYAPPALRRILY